MSDDSPTGPRNAVPEGPGPQETTPLTAAPRRGQPRKRRWGRIVIITIVALLVGISAAIGYFAVRINNAVSDIQREDSALPTGSRPPSATTTVQANYAPMNIAIIGSDTRTGTGGLSDSLMVLHISADRKSVYLVSFPRDMYVTIPGYGKNKINAAYSYGGSALSIKTLESLTGARIDHVVVTDFTSFVSLVDTVGPVTLDNPVASTRTATDSRGVRYDFRTKGQITLTDGYMALAFVRERENLPNGDLDRTLRQRAFLQALALKIATPAVLANPVTLNNLISTMGKFVTVDSAMTNTVIYSLALSMTGISSSDQIHMVMAPITGFGTVDGQSVDIVDTAGVAALGKALQNDTMAAYLAANPSADQGATASASASASASSSRSTAKATATATATSTKKK